MPEAEELRSHIAERYGFRAHTLYTLDQDVTLLRRDDGPSWVARVFSPERARAAVEGDAAVLQWLAEHGYPAERCAHAEPVSALGDSAVLVTEAVGWVPAFGPAGRDQRRWRHPRPRRAARAPAHAAAPVRPSVASGRSLASHRRGLTDGRAVGGCEWLDAAEAEAPARELAHFGELADALAAADPCEGLPAAMTHPDFVLANVVATREPSMVLVDWAGSGRGPRLWSLAFLLWAEGSKDLRRVDLALAGYTRRVTLEPEELDRLAAAITARPLVLDIWRLRNHGLGAADAVRKVTENAEFARAIAARVRAAIQSTGRYRSSSQGVTWTR